MSEQLRWKTFDTTAKAEGDRKIRFVISDGSVDRDNDTIDPAGWDLVAYRRNPVVLWAHSRSELPVGKCVQIGAKGGRLEATAEFAEHAFAEQVLRLYQGGFLRATSVGFVPLEWTRDEQRGGINFKRQELVEFSCVPVPANANALVAAAGAGIDTSKMKEWARKVLHGTDDEIVVDILPAQRLDIEPATFRDAMRAAYRSERLPVDAPTLERALRDGIRAGLVEAITSETDAALRYLSGKVA